MHFTFLGTGDVRQVPVFGCFCPACQRAQQQPERRRGPTSGVIRHQGQTTLLDAGQCHLEQQFAPGELDRIFLTHFHMDHVQGLFALRWGMGTKIPVYCPPDEQGCDDLYRHPGLLAFQPFLRPFDPVPCGDIVMTPLPLIHSKITYGYLIEQGGKTVAYLTDTVGLPQETLDFLRHRRIDHLVLDCSYVPVEAQPHNHNDITGVLALHALIAPRQCWLTHISHEVDNWLADNALPPGVAAAYDGLVLEI